MIGVVAGDVQGLWQGGAFGGWFESDAYGFGLALRQIESAAAADGEWWIQILDNYLKRGLALVFDLELFALVRIDLHRAETQVARNAQGSKRRCRSRSRRRRLSCSGRRRRGRSRGVSHGRRRA